MTLYLAANGQPFTDPDAAAFKADRMSAEIRRSIPRGVIRGWLCRGTGTRRKRRAW